MNNKNLQKYKFYVKGMHCNSCVVLTETEIGSLDYVKSVKADLGNCCVEVEGDFGDKGGEEIRQELSGVMKKHGYSLEHTLLKEKTKWGEFKWALPFSFIFIAIFIILQKLGIVNLVNAENVGYGTAFVVGIIASLSTCMAVVGGLVLSVSANYAKAGNRFLPQVFFHIGRLIAFFVLGGVIGSLGASFALGSTGYFILGLFVGLVMLILGVNLMDIFDITKKIQPTIPKFVSKWMMSVKNINNSFVPLLLGVITFFLPCGFTQSMQIYTLGAGGFLNGALIMFIFALGTLPVLSIISATTYNIGESKWRGTFFKTAGVIVVFFALINIANSLSVIGIIPPIFNF